MLDLLIASVCLLADGEAVPATVAPERVAILRQQLSNADFAVRQQATNALQNGNPEAQLADLLEVIRTGPPEASVRAVEVLAAWYAKSETVTEPLEDAIERLREAKGAVRELATVAWEDQQSARDKRSIARLQELGAKVQFVQAKKTEAPPDDDIELYKEPVVQHVVLGRNWRGGDAGLKHIARLSFVQTGVYRVKTAKVSEEALQKLTDKKPDLRIEIRGAFLGVTWMSSGAFGFGGPQPCLINEVAANSPAEKGGLKKDDIITQFGDKPVETFPDLIDLLKSTDPGEKVVFTVNREGEELKLPIELGDW